MAKTVGKILEDYIERMQRAGAEIGSSTALQAKFLGISAGHLSQLKNDKVKLSSEVMDKIASAIAETGVVEKEELIRELSRVRETPIEKKVNPSNRIDILFEAVGDFFGKVSDDKSLVCIDYRDFPQTTKDGPYPSLAVEAAHAVASGCSLALFQPFGTREALRGELDKLLDSDQRPEGRMYLFQLARQVRKVYKEIKEAAEKIARDRAEGGERPKECDIVLYEASTVQPLAACGISSRMLYASYMEDEKRRTGRVYQWVAGIMDEDFFIERSVTSVSPEAIMQQFNPISLYWFDAKKLPRTNAELRGVPERYRLGEELGWQVWEGEENGDD